MNTYKAVVNNDEYIISIEETTAETNENQSVGSMSDCSVYYCGIVKHILLCLFTFGIWSLIWIYRTTDFLNRTPGGKLYSPGAEILLNLFVPFYNIYWIYKHAKKLDEFAQIYNVKSDISAICLVCAIFIPIVAYVVLQDKINEICNADMN